jgi:hypothetical protein
MKRRHFVLFALAAGLGLPLTASATEVQDAKAPAAEAAKPDRIDRCLKSIAVIGASMGHVEKTDASGKSMLHFLVRANGSEYDVKCETDTGMVKDVSVRFPSPSVAN